MVNNLKETLAYVGGVALVTGAILGGVRIGNAAWNNKNEVKPGYEYHSKSKGIYGHEDILKLFDGSYEVKTYPRLSHRAFASVVYRDLDGDLEVDLIRKNGGELRMNSLKDFLVRETDYATHRDEFDEADEKLADLVRKYDLQ